MPPLDTLRPSLASLRKRIGLETPVEQADGAGGVTRTFSLSATLWGRVTPLRGEDGVVASARGQVLTHRVVLRHRTGLDTTMRLRVGARRLAIRAVYDPDERRRLLVCLCEEVRA
ncbi:MAG: phage head closure protein [Alsobacter sp.]